MLPATLTITPGLLSRGASRPIPQDGMTLAAVFSAALADAALRQAMAPAAPEYPNAGPAPGMPPLLQADRGAAVFPVDPKVQDTYSYTLDFPVGARVVQMYFQKVSDTELNVTAYADDDRVFPVDPTIPGATATTVDLTPDGAVRLINGEAPEGRTLGHALRALCALEARDFTAYYQLLLDQRAFAAAPAS